MNIPSEIIAGPSRYIHHWRINFSNSGLISPDVLLRARHYFCHFPPIMENALSFLGPKLLKTIARARKQTGTSRPPLWSLILIWFDLIYRTESKHNMCPQGPDVLNATKRSAGRPYVNVPSEIIDCWSRQIHPLSTCSWSFMLSRAWSGSQVHRWHFSTAAKLPWRILHLRAAGLNLSSINSSYAGLFSHRLEVLEVGRGKWFNWRSAEPRHEYRCTFQTWA